MNFSAVCAIRRCSDDKSSGVKTRFGSVSATKKFPPVKWAGSDFNSCIMSKKLPLQWLLTNIIPGRNPKVEYRNPNEIRRSKSEKFRRLESYSGFGFPSDFLRISTFGLRISNLVPRHL